ncbi:MAG: thioredoxin family protein [candidate division Zixibacteria bacterium]|nr:thioredoxin family protein [candidate division Zixibacteria bacterium]MCI0595746.1 thioredoxin family protein [candidate division Zixibacteria bacterium]
MRLRHIGMVAAAAILALAAFVSAEELPIGETGPAFALVGTDGKTYSLADYEDKKGVAVIFTCNACPYAKAFEDRINKLAKEYQAKGVAFVAINPNDPDRVPEDGYDQMVKRAKEKRFVFPYVYDSTSEVAAAYGAKVTPHVFLLDGNFKLVYRGRVEDETDAKKSKSRDLKNALNALLAGKKITVAETKAFGCSIKWRKQASAN